MRFVHLLGAAALLCAAAPVLGQDLDTRHYIYIEASGTTSLPAEFALVNATARNKAATPEAAIDSSNKTMGEVIALLKKSGVEPSDIQTGSFGFEAVYIKPESANSYEQPDPDRDKFDGYRATNGFTVKVRDLTKIGDVLGIISKQGVAIGKLTFGTSKQADAEESTRELAVENALARAERMAKAAHMKLGALLQMREGEGYNPETLENYPADGEADLGPAPVTGIVPADVVVTNSVSAKWEVVPLD